MSTWQEAVARWGLVSAPKETEQGQEETAPSSARKGLGWILGEIFSLKGLPGVEQAVQGSGGISISGGIGNVQMWCSGTQIVVEHWT